MRFSRLVAAAVAAVSLVAIPSSHAAEGGVQTTPACSTRTLPTTSAPSGTRSTTLSSDLVAVDGAQAVSVLCRLQLDPTFAFDTPGYRIAYQRICVGVNVCNGDSGWICVGVNVCNGNKPSRDICVGVDVCNKYYDSAVMFPNNVTYAAQPGQPVFLCSVVQWKDAQGNAFYSAYNAGPQQPGTQCPVASVA